MLLLQHMFLLKLVILKLLWLLGGDSDVCFGFFVGFFNYPNYNFCMCLFYFRPQKIKMEKNRAKLCHHRRKKKLFLGLVPKLLC